MDKDKMAEAFQILEQYKKLTDKNEKDMLGLKNDRNKYATQRLFPFPHLRWNYAAVARDLLKVEPMPLGALPIYEKNEEDDIDE